MSKEKIKPKIESILLHGVSNALLVKISEAKRAVMEANPTKRNVTNTEAINFIVFGKTEA